MLYFKTASVLALRLLVTLMTVAELQLRRHHTGDQPEYV